MPEFAYTDLLPLGPDATDYRLLTADGITRRQAFGRDFLEVDPEVLTLVAREGMRDIAHLLRPGTCASCGPSWMIRKPAATIISWLLTC